MRKIYLCLFKILLLGIFLAASPLTAQQIAFQGFEGTFSDTWAFANNPATYNVSGDVWDNVTAVGNINVASTGSNFWGMRDLNNPNGGGNFDHVLRFVQTGLGSFTNVQITFDYNAFEYDAGDDLTYEVFFDGVSQGVTNLIVGVNGGGTSTNNPANNDWETETINVTAGMDSVRLRLIATQNGGGDYAGWDNVSITGTSTAPCVAAPTTPASNVNFNNVMDSSFTVNWTNGNGSRRIVVVRAGSAVAATPTNSTTYNADPVFGQGDDLGAMEYVVYNGLGNSVTVTGLDPGTEYFVAVYEYNCAPGSELYNTTAASGGSFTRPGNVTDFDFVCLRETSASLSWNLPTGAYDGILIFARENQVPADPNQDVTTYVGADPDYSNAPTYGARGRLVYRGNGQSVNITGLANGGFYTFKAFTYAGATNTEYSPGTQRSDSIYLNDVSSLNANPGDTEIAVFWQNPGAGCFDEILVVADETPGVQFTPTGDGSAYTANAAYAAAGQVVFKGTGTDVTVTGLTNGTEYCFEVFVRTGTDWSRGEEVCAVSGPELFPGDFMIIGYDNNINAGVDRLVLTNLVEIETGTSFSIANATYELGAAANQRTGRWYSADGNATGEVASQRITYLGNTNVASGSIWCVDLPTGFGVTISDLSINGVAQTLNTDFSVIEDGAPNGVVNFSVSNPDPIFLMQGTWDIQPAFADFNGRVLGGIQEGGLWYRVDEDLTALTGNDANRRSRIPPEIRCFAIQGSTTPSDQFAYYTGNRNGTQRELISRIIDYPTNYTPGAGTNTNDLPGTTCTNSFAVTATLNAGQWVGDTDNNWFNCANWSNFAVPDEQVDVTIAAASFDAVIDADSSFSDEYADTARAKSITLSGPQALRLEGDSANVLVVARDLSMIGTGLLDLDDGNITTPDGQLLLFGDFTKTSTLDLIRHGNGTVKFLGNGAQSLSLPVTFPSLPDTLSRLVVDKPTGTLTLAQPLILAARSGPGALAPLLDLRNGRVNLVGTVPTTNFSLAIASNDPTSLGNFGPQSYLYGNAFVRQVLVGNTYDFPVGTAVLYELATMEALTGIDANVSARFEDNLGGFAQPSVSEGGNTFETILDAGVWEINFLPLASGIPSAGTFDLTLNETGFTNAGSDFVVGFYDDVVANTWALFGSPGAVTNGPALVVAERQTLTSTAFGTVDQYYGILTNNPAPLNLLSLEGVRREADVLLNWTVANVDTRTFLVERSADANNFDPIGETAALPEGEVHAYRFVDADPLTGRSYYRLRWRDVDGRENISPTVEVRGKQETLQIKGVYPNPTSSGASLQLFSAEAGTLRWQLIGLEGRVLRGQQLDLAAGDHRLEIDATALAPGIYLLQVEMAGQRITRRLIRR